MKKNEIITAKLVGLTTFIHQNFRIEYKGKGNYIEEILK